MVMAISFIQHISLFLNIVCTHWTVLWTVLWTVKRFAPDEKSDMVTVQVRDQSTESFTN